MKHENRKGNNRLKENLMFIESSKEVVNRFGSATKEHLVAYSGRDNEFGKDLNRSLKSISESKVNCEYANQNIKQQAGYSAEIKYTARKNAENIINGREERYIRTDDLGQVNDPLYDHVMLDKYGNVIPETGEQMKFVGSNPISCLTKLKSKFYQKYFDADAKIVIPSDYYEGIKDEADKQINKLEQQLLQAKQQREITQCNNLTAKISKLRKIKSSIKSSGITYKEHIKARTHPFLSTTDDIEKIANKSALEGAKTGVAISGGLSLIKNTTAVIKGEKKTSEAAADIVKDTGKGAVSSYIVVFSSTIVKGCMQNAKNSTIRSLSNTSAPSMIVTSAIDISCSFKKYLNGELSGDECVSEIGEKGVSSLSSYTFALIGQSLIPVPVVGGMIGSAVGYTLSSTLIQYIKDVQRKTEMSIEQRKLIEAKCREADMLLEKYRKEYNSYMNGYFSKYKYIIGNSLSKLDEALLTNNPNLFIEGANQITEAYGGKVLFRNMDEFNRLMDSDESFDF